RERRREKEREARQQNEVTKQHLFICLWMGCHQCGSQRVVCITESGTHQRQKEWSTDLPRLIFCFVCVFGGGVNGDGCGGVGGVSGHRLQVVSGNTLGVCVWRGRSEEHTSELQS